MLSRSDMLIWLKTELDDAAKQHQVQQLEPPLFVYHRGIYRNHATIWTPNAEILQTQPGRFNIQARLTHALTLLAVSPHTWQALCRHLSVDINRPLSALSQLCDLLNSNHIELSSQIQGVILHTNNRSATTFLILFKPLRDLQLHEIQDLYPDSSLTDG